MASLRKKAWLAFKKAFYYDTRPTEFFSICFLMWWAVLLASTQTTFQSSPGLRYMASVASQNSWSVLCFTLALLHVASLVFNLYELRRLCCFLISIFWMAVSYMIFLANPVAVGTGVCAIVAFSTAWVTWRGPHNDRLVYVKIETETPAPLINPYGASLRGNT